MSGGEGSTVGSAWREAPVDLALSPGHVDLWQVGTDYSDAALAGLSGWLTEEERQKAGRLRIAAKRAEAIVARALLRRTLGRLLKCEPRELVFTAGAHGKPGLAEPKRGVHFNLSHTQNRVVLAVSPNRRVGVDVEHLRPGMGAEDLARRFFTAGEHEALLGLPEGERVRAFFRLWTRKEALLKGTGSGISAGLDSQGFPVGAMAEPMVCRTGEPEAEWSVCEVPLEAGTEYLAALASETWGDVPGLRLWRMGEGWGG